MPEKLQEFQLEFGRYLRDPQQMPLPGGINTRRAKIYEDLLFNNVSGFLNSCFPVCRLLIGKDLWYNARRRFFSEWRCHSPYFRNISHEFLQFLQHSDMLNFLPEWFYELAYYEWVELKVDTMHVDTIYFNEYAQQNDVRGKLLADATLHNLEFQWPVHRISSDFIPDSPSPAFLAVYRNADYKVKFTELNAATSLLVRLIQETSQQGEFLNRFELVECFAELTQQNYTDELQRFADQTLDVLIEQQILFENA